MQSIVHKARTQTLKNKGFTILETLVAIAILLTAITGPIDIMAQALKASYYSRDEVTAFYLAQEAVEYARNQRDDNVLDPSTTVPNWLTDVVGTASVNCLNDATVADAAKSKCALVQDSGGVYSYESCGLSCLAIGDVMKKSAAGIYGVTSGTNTTFTREVYFTRVPSSDLDAGGSPDLTGANNTKEVLMTVNIFWTNSFGSGNKFTMTDRLFNWKLTN